MATKDLEMHFIELPKFIKKHPGVNTKLEQWLWLLVGEGRKVVMAENENKNVKKEVNIIDKISIATGLSGEEIQNLNIDK